MGNKEIKRSEKMGRKSLISSLPRDVLLELNDVIRTNEYGNQDEVLKWLTERSLKGSKSALNRYINQLKARDGFDGKAGSFRLMTGLTAKDNNIDLLYKELGEIEFRRQEIIEIIRNLTGK
ncbi:Protein of uncharacterised function (DUF3486) [Aggregatibacter actinomycetemcomitans]|uniref:phage protein Gp27 family protein n=1 Tax=Aggregatibacter actinomycetemcomitans TaxID=714 RepID=UPI00022BFCF6|nr:phage protein Gp27 family protein [Aggregatibacter actinomycetemcomitans]KYK77656.1 hypothetical protein SC383S_10260 [Aggregatibacter actinomycetemcomitans SC383s]SSY85132.1 Protein of uncharacterised function (DUF3486) [Aggregatibacter actinomycetemcomitans]